MRVSRKGVWRKEGGESKRMSRRDGLSDNNAKKSRKGKKEKYRIVITCHSDVLTRTSTTTSGRVVCLLFL